MLELSIDSNSEYLDASLQLTGHKKTSGEKHYPVLVVSGRTTKRVVYIPNGISDIYLMPSEKAALLNINSIKFIKLTTKKALKLMHKKLLTFLPDNEFKYTLQLWRHYEQLFHRQQKSEADYSLWTEKREHNLLKQQLHINISTCFTVILDISSSSYDEIILNQLLSLERQFYSSWDLILIIDSATPLSNEVDALIHQIRHKVLKILPRNTKDEIRVSDFLKLSSTDYFFHLQSDCILSPFALSIFSRTIESNKNKGIIYADDDFLDKDGRRLDPIFKSDWNPDLLLSSNYIGECVVIHKNLLNKSALVTVDSLSVWVYELLVTSALAKEQNTHISLILTHKVKTTTKASIHHKNLQQLSVLKKHLRAFNADAIQGKISATFRVMWPIRDTEPLVSIIMPTRDGLATLKRAIDSIFEKTTYTNFEIIIIDNQSKKNETKQYLKSLTTYNNVQVLLYDKPFNYSAINNYAAQFAQGPILALLNNDIQVINSDWLREMVSHCQREDIGCVGAMLYYPDDRIQHAGVIVGLGGCAGHSHKFYRKGDLGYNNRLICTQNYSAVTGACLLIRKSVFEEVEGLNENSLKVAFNDVDLCLKVQALGYRNLWTPWSELYHYESVSRGQDNTKEKRRRLNKEVAYMKDTWKTTSVTDPYYNKFLTHIREDFSLGL